MTRNDDLHGTASPWLMSRRQALFHSAGQMLNAPSWTRTRFTKRFTREPGWILEETASELKTERRSALSRRRLWDLRIQDHPLATAFCCHAVILLSVVAAFIWRLEVFPNLAPADSQAILLVAWQVHSSFVAIAFAGLALLFQLSTEPLMTAHTVRALLFRKTRFALLLLYSLIGSVQLAVVSAWLPSDGALVLELLFVVITSIALIAFAYSLAARTFTDARFATNLSQEAILQSMLDSMDSTWASIEANQRLQHFISPDYLLTSNSGVIREVVVAPNDIRLTDAHIPRLRAALADLANHSILIQSLAATGTNEIDVESASIADSPRLFIRASIGERLGSGNAVFVIQNPKNYTGDISRFEARLRAAIRTEPT